MLERIVLHGEFSLFTVRGNFWYQIYQNQRQKILCQLMALINITYSVCTNSKSINLRVNILCLKPNILYIIGKVSLSRVAWYQILGKWMILQ